MTTVSSFKTNISIHEALTSQKQLATLIIQLTASPLLIYSTEMMTYTP